MNTAIAIDITPNGKPMTESRLSSWQRAIKKARALSADGLCSMGRGHHPQTGHAFHIYPSATNGGSIHYCFFTGKVFSCLCQAAQNGNACWHAALYLIEEFPILASVIEHITPAELWSVPGNLAAKVAQDIDDGHKGRDLAPLMTAPAGARLFR